MSFFKQIKHNKQSIEDLHLKIAERNLKNMAEIHILIKDGQAKLESKQNLFESRYSHLFNPRKEARSKS